ncbi:MAG: alpha/beta hydrolase [Gammaproteobacteria bacterium]|uniref:alpha/beta fold hydrolase n=1 Tax=Pseudomaricurvus alcaniphilus TaxID=1166482 RepID=UPI00140755B7|nr:alpha/beta hydrolase [Pseudomaricurvus alcaniphilus]MBR9910855.1 alpha/beta hydrolase [Gammaproteobacteria bacterium]NHN37267.1 alpha/beta hydrolase [Pseudomaricurvus alcaniphilus]
MTAAVAEHRIDVDGARLRVFDWPAAQAGAPTLMLVHGYRANAHWWDGIVAELRGRFRILVPEFSGMGGSESRSCYRDNQGAIDLVGVIESLDLQLDCVVAHSWGGHQMAVVTRMLPHRVAQLVWVDSFFMVEVDEQLPAGAPTGNARVYRDKEDAIARFRTSPPQPMPEALRRDLAQKSLRQCDGGWVWSYDPGLPPLQPRPDDEALLRDLPVKSHYLLAGNSPVVGLTRAKRIAMLAQSATFQVVAEGHHHVMLDAPQQLLAALTTLGI